MVFQYLYAVLLFATFSITAAIAINAWHTRGARGSALFACMAAATAAYVLTSGLMSLGGTPERALAWVNPHYFSLTVMVAFFFCFTLTFTGFEKILNKPVVFMICAVPVLTQIIIETNGMHHWFIRSIRFQPHGLLMGLESIEYGPFVLFHSVYNYLLVLTCIVLIIRNSIRTFMFYRMQSLMLLSGVIPPLAASLNDSRLFSLSFEYPLVPLGFALMDIAFAVGISRHKMLKVVPIARDVLVESMGDAMIVLDSDSNIVDMNPACRKLLDLDASEVIGKPAAAVLSRRRHLLDAIDDRMPLTAEISLPVCGEDRHFDLRVSPLVERRNRNRGRMIVLRDITSRKRMENDLKASLSEVNSLQERLYRQATRDSQTELFNRRYLNEVLPREMARASREKSQLGFVLLDIDDFKAVNDIYGHAAGDSVIRHVASLLLDLTRENDLVFRYGGDEFLILMPSAPTEAALQAAERWKRSLLESRVVFEGSEIPVSLSIGISIYPHHGETADEVLSAADTAMYRGKTSGKNKVVLYG